MNLEFMVYKLGFKELDIIFVLEIKGEVYKEMFFDKSKLSF